MLEMVVIVCVSCVVLHVKHFYRNVVIDWDDIGMKSWLILTPSLLYSIYRLTSLMLSTTAILNASVRWDAGLCNTCCCGCYWWFL